MTLCAVDRNAGECLASWKCTPGEGLCVWRATPCPVCGGRLVHYRREHEEAGAMEGFE